MYFITYDKDGILQHLRTTKAQCAGAFGYLVVSNEQAEILREEGEFHKWRVIVDPSIVFTEESLYRLPDCDPKYHITVDGKVTEMDAEAKAALDAQQAPPVDAEAMKVRQDRSGRLAACDWTRLLDSPVLNQEAWSQYRQELRDITKQPGFPNEVTWPEAP